MPDMGDVEALLRSALVPVEPAGHLSDRLERGLSEITDFAADELADWELSTMRDPRNWGPTVAAAVVGSTAAGALVLVKARRRHRNRGSGSLSALEQGVREVSADLRSRLRR
ncbi:MAG: hypothetical protein ACR2HC_08805 [Thermoleophilaceae bacterium]